MKIKPELGRFLFQNMFAHDPCHDFSPAGGGKRMHKLNSRFDQVSKMFNTPALGGGYGKVQSGGKLADLNPIEDRDSAGDYRGINGGEAVGIYSGFEADGAIITVTRIVNPAIKQIIVDRYKVPEDKARVSDVLSIMDTSIQAVMPKDDNETIIPVSHDVQVNAGAFIFRRQVGTVTRSAENFRRVYINKMQEVIEMNDYVRLTIVMHNVVAPADTTATVIAAVADAAVADAAVDARVGFDPVYGGKAYNSRTILRPPPSPNSTKNKEEYAAKLRLLKKMSTLAPVQARSSNKVSPRSTKNNGIEMPILAQVLASTSELAEPEQASTPAAVPPSGNTYTNMYLILDHLYNEYEDAKSSLAANDEVADLSESLDDMKNVIKFYRFAFEYYATHIENMSSMYSINNSDFIKDVLLYYFIDLYANRYTADAVEPSKLMSDDASYRNSVFEIIYMLRKPIKKEMGGGANSKVMTGGSNADYDAAVILVNSIPLATCSLNDAKYTITWINPAPAPQEIAVTEVTETVNTALIAINENAKKHLLALVPEGWLTVVTDGIKAKVDAAFNKDDPKSLWNKEHKGQLHRFLIRGVNQRNGDKAIKAQLDRLITDVKSQMLNVLRQNHTAIKEIPAVVQEAATGSLSVTAKYVANGFLKQLCTTIQANCKQETPEETPAAPPPADVKVNYLYDTQDRILDKIKLTGPYPNLDSDLLAGFVNEHELKMSDLNVALKQSCLVNTPNFINNNVIVKTLRNGMNNPNSIYRTVNIINNALMTKYPPDTKYVDYLVNTFKAGSNIDGFKGIKFENMCPVTCVLDAMGSFGSCSNGHKSDKYDSLKYPTQMFIETQGDDKKFEFNMTTRHKNNVVIVEYYLIYDGFTVSNCVIEATIKESAVNILSANNTFADVLNYIEQNAPTNPTELMSWETFFNNHSANIVRIISRKMIGDFGQELSAVYPIGGYYIDDKSKQLPDTSPWNWPSTAILQNSKVNFILKTNGDRPSFVREAHLLLAEPDETNENTVIMYLGDTNGIVVMSKQLQAYLATRAGGAVQTKRTPHTKKRTTRNHKRTRKISARKTRRLKRNP